MGCQRATKLTTERVSACRAAARRARKFLPVDGRGFFQDQVLSGLQGLDRLPGVEIIGHADRDDIHRVGSASMSS